MMKSVFFSLCLCLSALPGQGVAACRLALLLAIDVSSSIDDEEYALQRDGLAAAILNEDVQAALLPNAGNTVALAVYEWSGRYQSEIKLDWTAIRTRADILRVAETLAAATRSQKEFPTAIGYALGFGATMLRHSPPCDDKKIDLSGDGPNNEGFAPPLAYAAFPLADVTVNALAIEATEPGLSEYYRREVVNGPGAFVIAATGFHDFKRAMTMKLLRELGDMLMGDAAPDMRLLR